MKYILAIGLLMLGLTSNAQNELKRFMQPANVVNKIPYGANAEAGNYIQSGTAKIYYELYGKGEPFVLLHGGLFGSTIEMADFIDSLSKTYLVIAISTRGHGKSELGHDLVSLEQRANDVKRVIQKVTNKQVMMLGFSDGGYTAYQFAVLFPELVKKMIVIGAGVLKPGQRDFNFNVQQAMALDQAFWKQQLALMPAPNRLSELFKQINDCYSNLTIDKAMLEKIKCPVLVMAGDRDEGNPVENVLKAASFIPNHQLAIIPNTGHPTFNENFAAAWACVLPFIKNK